MDPDKTNEALVAARDLALNAGQALANASGGSGDAAADFFQRVVVSALKKLASQSPPPDEVPAAISIIKAICRAESSQKSRGDSHLAAVHELFPPPSPVSLSFRPLRRTNLARPIDPHLSSSMAERFGLGPSSTADSMTVVNTPNQDLALTNFAYCASTDLNKFAASGSNHVFVLVGDAIVLTLRAHQSIPSNHIALNAIQRRHTRVSSGDQISVARFIPPANFKLALLTLELDFVKAKTSRTEQLDAVVITQQLQRKFIDQVK